MTEAGTSEAATELMRMGGPARAKSISKKRRADIGRKLLRRPGIGEIGSLVQWIDRKCLSFEAHVLCLDQLLMFGDDRTLAPDGVTEPGYVPSPEACHAVPVSLCESGAEIVTTLNLDGLRCVHVGIMHRPG